MQRFLGSILEFSNFVSDINAYTRLGTAKGRMCVHLGVKFPREFHPSLKMSAKQKVGTVGLPEQEDVLKALWILTWSWLSFLPFSSPKTQHCGSRLNQPTPDIFHQL